MTTYHEEAAKLAAKEKERSERLNSEENRYRNFLEVAREEIRNHGY